MLGIHKYFSHIFLYILDSLKIFYKTTSKIKPTSINKTIMRLSTILLAFALVSLPAFVHGHAGCNHDKLEHNHQIHEIEEEIFPSHDASGRVLASYPQVRMAANYDALNSAPAAYKTYMEKQLVPAVLDYFSAALKIKTPLKSKITLSASTVCGLPTPSILKTGVAADYLILLDSALDEESSWVAESYSCYLASSSKRPYIAKTVFNRDLLKDASNNVLLHEKNTYLLLHEMLHTLGFSKSLYKYYLDVNGKVMTDHIKTVSLHGTDRMVLDVPSLTQRARNYFGCPTLEGVFLEDDGGSASYGSHLERSQFVMEHMTSGLIYTQRISEFSLGLLEATGWYVPDYTFADPYWFGQGQGCGFIQDKCGSTGFDAKGYGYCTGTSSGCGFHGRGGAKCVGDTKSNSCRYMKPDVNYDCENLNAEDYVRLPSLQTFGREAGSKCFSGTLSSTSSSASTTSFCFKYKCTGSGTSTKLTVNVGTKSITCSKEGTVSVSGYKGKLNCPDPIEFCSTIGKPYCPRNCGGRGTCVDNKCVCKTGFTGIDCGIAL